MNQKQEQLSLDGRVCLVVGGVSGIGRAITTALADSGATVIATTSRNYADTLPAQVVHLDVREPHSIREVMDLLSLDHGRLDVLVYNSGLAGPSKPIDEVSDEEWEEVFAVNITGFFRLCRASFPLLRKAVGGGRIIAISSITGRRPLLHRAPYAATKLALTGFVRSLALEAGRDAITVNTISPGYVEGDRLQWVVKAQAEAQGVTLEEMQSRFLSHSPLGKMVAPESIARTVVFLADAAARDITGIDITVSAGVWMD